MKKSVRACVSNIDYSFISHKRYNCPVLQKFVFLEKEKEIPKKQIINVDVDKEKTIYYERVKDISYLNDIETNDENKINNCFKEKKIKNSLNEYDKEIKDFYNILKPTENEENEIKKIIEQLKIFF